uniref:Ras-associating domain-containing protein n=1 Tax=Panagrellus redivivus TaxID=6233 RepID=A0A7E5A1Z1_PANRE
MLKYQVRAASRTSFAPSAASTSTSTSLASTASPSQQHRTIIAIRPDDGPASIRASTTSLSSASGSSFASTSSPRPCYFRSNSLSSLSSLDSADSADWGNLRVFTGNIKTETDYKTIRLSTQTTVKQVIEQLLGKFRLTCRDPNLYQLWMEVTTRRNGSEVKTLLELDATSRPLELSRCHPADLSRFILHQANNGVLIRVHDSDICPESNYKSLLVSPRTTTAQVVGLLLQMARLPPAHYRLMIVDDLVEVEIPDGFPVAHYYQGLRQGQKIVVRKWLS